MAAFDNFRAVVLASDGDTPAALLEHVGTRVMVPATQQVSNGPGELAGLPGYGRMVGDVQQWVMTGPRDELLAYVNRMPPAGSWAVEESRLAVRRAARKLRDLGVTAVELRDILRDIDLAVRADAAATPPTP